MTYPFKLPCFSVCAPSLDFSDTVMLPLRFGVPVICAVYVAVPLKGLVTVMLISPAAVGFTDEAPPAGSRSRCPGLGLGAGILLVKDLYTRIKKVQLTQI